MENDNFLDGQIHIVQTSDRLMIVRDGIIIHEEISEDEEEIEFIEINPSIVCVKEIGGLLHGGFYKYFADTFQYDNRNMLLNVYSEGVLVASHNSERVDRVWLDSCLVKRVDDHGE